MKKFRIIALLLALTMLLGCGSAIDGEQDAQGVKAEMTAEPVASTTAIFIDDITMIIGETIVLKPEFTGERDAVAYSVADESVCVVRNGMLRAAAEGATEVTVSCENSEAACTFSVTVTKEAGVEAIDEFNIAGGFDNEDPLGKWEISGATAELHIVESDAEGGNSTNAFKLWCSDDGPIDVTLSRALVDMPAGTYTFTMKARAGMLDELAVSINGEQFLWSAGQIMLNKNTSYFVYELAEDGDIAFSVTVTAAEGNSGWGYLDDIAVEKGDTAPLISVFPANLNYSFENGLEDWVLEQNDGFLGAVNAYSTTTAATGVYAINYWGEKGASDAFTLKQTVTGLTEGTYRLSIMMMIGCDLALTELSEAYIYIRDYDGEGSELQLPLGAVTGWNEGNMTLYALEGIEITQSTAEIGLYMSMGENTVWIHFDDFLLEKV